MTIYEKLFNYYTKKGFELVEAKDSKSIFFDDDEEQSIVINNMNLMSIKDLIYTDNLTDFIKLDVLTDCLSKVNKHLFTFVDKIIFVKDESDIWYIEEQYSAYVNENYLAQYNPENSLVIINVKHILERAYSILEDEFILSNYTLNNFTSEEILISIMHEVFHCIADKDILHTLNPILPFNIYDIEDESMEEYIVEKHAKKLILEKNSKVTFMDDDFVSSYKPEEFY